MRTWISWKQSHIYLTYRALLYILSPASKKKQLAQLDIYIDWLRENNESLLGELAYDIESVEDEQAKTVMWKLLQMMNTYQNMQSILLSKILIQMREHEIALDRELYEMSSAMTEILDVHIMEAENLRKIK